MLLAALMLSLAPAPLSAAETVETVLIRQSLEKDRSGRRRGDVELVTSAYHEEGFSVFDGGGVIDPLGWKVAYESLEEYQTALGEDLRLKRYDIERTVTFINVWRDKAFAVTVDSGKVADRSTGATTPYAVTSLWTFRKENEEWFATALFSDVADSTRGRYQGDSGMVDADVAAFLTDEAKAWQDGDAAAVAGHFDKEFIFCDSYHEVNPAKWWVVFADAEELEEWLEERLALVSYDIDREVLHTSVGASRRTALAVTLDVVTGRYQKGDAVHSETRHVVWVLRKRGSGWRVTNLLSKINRPAAGS